MVNNDSIHLIQSSLKARGMRQTVIANNIANADTPGFRRSDVAFEDALAKALEGRRGDAVKVEPSVVTPMDTAVNSKGNDVDLENEFGELMKNDGAMKVQLRLMSKLYQQMTLAMQVE